MNCLRPIFKVSQTQKEKKKRMFVLNSWKSGRVDICFKMERSGQIRQFNVSNHSWHLLGNKENSRLLENCFIWFLSSLLFIFFKSLATTISIIASQVHTLDHPLSSFCFFRPCKKSFSNFLVTSIMCSVTSVKDRPHFCWNCLCRPPARTRHFRTRQGP